REGAPVSARALDVVEPRQHPQAPLGAQVDRRLVAEPAIDRVGVLGEEERAVLNHPRPPAPRPGPTTARPARRSGSGRCAATTGSSGTAACRAPMRPTG